jgi:hypothetical protein
VELNGKLGFIDEKGKEVVAPVYDSIGYFGEYALDLAVVILDGKKAFIDRRGNRVLSNTISISPFR